jgi:hypothetical protein
MSSPALPRAGREELHEEVDEHPHLGKLGLLAREESVHDPRFGLELLQHHFEIAPRQLVGHVVLERLHDATAAWVSTLPAPACSRPFGEKVTSPEAPRSRHGSVPVLER